MVQPSLISINCVISMELNAGRLYRDFKLRKKKEKGTVPLNITYLGTRLDITSHITVKCRALSKVYKVFKISRLIDFCDVVCWILTSAVHRF